MMNGLNKPQVFLDVRWLSCPYNQMKVLLALHELKEGNVLEVLVEEGEPYRCVSDGIEKVGSKITFSEKIIDSDSNIHYRIWIQK